MKHNLRDPLDHIEELETWLVWFIILLIWVAVKVAPHPTVYRVWMAISFATSLALVLPQPAIPSMKVRYAKWSIALIASSPFILMSLGRQYWLTSTVALGLFYLTFPRRRHQT